ncbi:hypothetical protein [Croceicoccus hydrothermalis]|uniref:hypothetical protein n=1 Tax=Croceicoccus hydrothermalis TaxID=2867964 RepID=UPI001EFA6CFE|nr:hypothetical protein [Croceicoccus hydrothermalis]
MAFVPQVIEARTRMIAFAIGASTGAGFAISSSAHRCRRSHRRRPFAKRLRSFHLLSMPGSTMKRYHAVHV